MIIVVVFFTIVYVNKIVGKLKIQSSKIKSANIEDKQFRSEFANIEIENEKNCTKSVIYCFDDDDCRVMCSDKGRISCLNGICKTKKTITRNIENKCDVKLGYYAYLVGDTMFGDYKYVCKSIDPGIAVLDENNKIVNRICNYGSINVDYRKNIPMAGECNCPSDTHYVELPNTKTIRNRAFCVSEPIFDYIQKSNQIVV